MRDLHFRPGWWVIPGLIVEAVIIALVLLSCAAEPAKAQATAICGDYETMAASLRLHGERPLVIGLDPRGYLAETWISPTGGWSWITVDRDGYACLIGSGDRSETLLSRFEERQG